MVMAIMSLLNFPFILLFRFEILQKYVTMSMKCLDKTPGLRSFVSSLWTLQDLFMKLVQLKRSVIGVILFSSSVFNYNSKGWNFKKKLLTPVNPEYWGLPKL